MAVRMLCCQEVEGISNACFILQERLRKIKLAKENKAREVRGEAALPDHAQMQEDGSWLVPPGKWTWNTTTMTWTGEVDKVSSPVASAKETSDAKLEKTLGPAVKVIAMQKRVHDVQEQQAAALQKVNDQAPKFKQTVSTVASMDSTDAKCKGQQSDGKMTIGQLTSGGLKIDISITEPRRTLDEENSCRQDSQRMKRDLDSKVSSHTVYKKMQAQRQRLPAYEMQDTILDAVHKNQVLPLSPHSLR